jgi:Xaa-Pro dipeptidase
MNSQTVSKIQQAQKYLKERRLDGWLLYDFHGSNKLARYFLEMPANKMTTRRYFYWIPAFGDPIKVVHAIEENALSAVPGEKKIYSSWQSLEKNLAQVLKGAKKVAMEYSPRNAIPYVSLVDGGTVDLIRSFGIEVVSSADFLSNFTAVLTDEQVESHRRAAKALDRIVNSAWEWIHDQLAAGKQITEYDVQQKIVADFRNKDLVTDHDPIVAVNAHSADPHYAPKEGDSSLIRKEDFILIDLWAKEMDEKSIFGDLTRVAVAADQPSAMQQEIFDIVRRAQKAGVELVKSRFAEERRIEGWEVDEAVRSVITEAGYGKNFIHRTGHNIEMTLHGSGADMDNLEMHDVRPILPGTVFSVEPGIYLPGEFGVRLELDVLVRKDGRVEVTTGEQDSIVCLF